MKDIDPNLWELKFGVEVSALYHDWRRGTMEAAQRFSRSATILGIVVTLATSFASVGHGALHWTTIGILFVIACVNIAELTYRFNERAREHLDLYKRFSALQVRMAKITGETNETLAEWEAEAAEVRRDEPPTMWAVYAMCWNQQVEFYRQGRDHKEHYREIGWFKYLLRNLLQFRPKDFPPLKAT